MNKRMMTAAVAALFALTGCQNEKEDKFSIQEGKVGLLEKNTTLEELETIYASDSLVRDTGSSAFATRDPRIKIFEKGGKHLLTLTPVTDSVTTIENINIHDPRYTTGEGISLGSTFKDIRDHYTIKKLVTFRNNVVIFVKESAVYFTIDRDQLPASIRYTPDTKVEAVQIPDGAKIKYMMVGWD